MSRADPSCRRVLPSMYVSLSVAMCNNNLLHLQSLDRRGQTKEKRTPCCILLDIYLNILTIHGPVNVKKKLMQLL